MEAKLVQTLVMYETKFKDIKGFQHLVNFFMSSTNPLMYPFVRITLQVHNPGALQVPLSFFSYNVLISNKIVFKFLRNITRSVYFPQGNVPFTSAMDPF